MDSFRMVDFKSPMLAAKPKPADYEKITYPKLASPKLDGIRAVVQGGQVWSRKGILIPNKRVQRTFGRKAYEGFDGELIVGEPTGQGVFGRTTSGVMSVEGEPDVQFYVFDFLRGNVKGYAYTARLRELERHVDVSKDYEIVVVEQLSIRDDIELDHFEAVYLADGYEGMMLRDPAGAHKHGRSTMREQGLIAIKRFAQAEGVILACNEEMANTNVATLSETGHSKRSSHKAGKVVKGRLGSCTVRVTDCSELPEMIGQTLNVGAGFSADERSIFWAQRGGMVGKEGFQFKFQAHGVKDKPRIPVYTGFRDPRV